MAHQPSIYLAGPLFTDAQRAFNRQAADGLRRAGCTVFLPQDTQTNVTETDWQDTVFKRNCEGICAAKLVVAVLDGCLVDDGTAWEIGYAYALGKPVVGIHTDRRTVGHEGRVNLMVEQACTVICGADWSQVARVATGVLSERKA